MATATQTATSMSRPARSLPSGVISKTISFNSGTTSVSGASVIEMCNIPNKATILDIVQYHTTGAASCPVDIGMKGDTASTFASAATQAAVSRATQGIPYRVSKSDDAANQFDTLTVTATPGTATASFKIDLTVLYTMDE